MQHHARMQDLTPGFGARRRGRRAPVPTARLVSAVALGLVCCAGASASAANESIPGTIVPAVGVGKLELGMSEPAARAVLRPLGPPIRARRERPHRVKGYVEWQYPRFEVAFGATSYVVGFKARRLVWIEIRTWRNATRKGVRVSTTKPRLLSAYGRLPCRSGLRDGSPNVPFYCRLGKLAGRHTIFEVTGDGLIASGRPPPGPARVAGIIIREPYIPLEP